MMAIGGRVGSCRHFACKPEERVFLHLACPGIVQPRGTWIGVAEQVLDLGQFESGSEQGCRGASSEAVAREPFTGNARFDQSSPDHSEHILRLHRSLDVPARMDAEEQRFIRIARAGSGKPAFQRVPEFWCEGQVTPLGVLLVEREARVRRRWGVSMKVHAATSELRDRSDAGGGAAEENDDRAVPLTDQRGWVDGVKQPTNSPGVHGSRLAAFDDQSG